MYKIKCRGGRAWSNARDLGSRPLGVRAFKSLPLHFFPEVCFCSAAWNRNGFQPSRSGVFVRKGVFRGGAGSSVPRRLFRMDFVQIVSQNRKWAVALCVVLVIAIPLYLLFNSIESGGAKEIRAQQEARMAEAVQKYDEDLLRAQ